MRGGCKPSLGLISGHMLYMCMGARALWVSLMAMEARIFPAVRL